MDKHVTVFDSPQWKWQVTRDKIKIGDLSNSITVNDIPAVKSKVIQVVYPAELFKWINDVLRLDDLRGTHIYLDRRENKEWILGVEQGNDFWDLWSYGTDVPKWLDKNPV